MLLIIYLIAEKIKNYYFVDFGKLVFLWMDKKSFNFQKKFI